MDEDTRSRDWGYYESPSRHLGLQLRPSAVERDAKPFLSHHHHHRGGDSNAFLNNNGGYHHNRDYGVPELLAPMDFISNDSWMNHRDNKFLHGLSGNPNNKLVHGFPGNSNKLVHGNGMPTPGNPNNKIVHGMPHPGNPNKYLHGMPPSGNSNKHLHGMSDSGNHGFSLISETSNTHQQFHMQPPALLDIPSGERFAQLEEPPIKKRGASLRKQQTPKSPKAKKPKDDAPPVQRAKPLKNHSTGLIINGIDLDIAGIPSPVCSCTGIPQQCYRWGCGGWQSACCTTSISMYPLPMSTKRRGARISGRKMSLGAFKKVLEKLVGEGYNLSNPIDLRTHWAKHGTNKFVTIR